MDRQKGNNEMSVCILVFTYPAPSPPLPSFLLIRSYMNQAQWARAICTNSLVRYGTLVVSVQPIPGERMFAEEWARGLEHFLPTGMVGWRVAAGPLRASNEGH